MANYTGAEIVHGKAVVALADVKTACYWFHLGIGPTGETVFFPRPVAGSACIVTSETSSSYTVVEETWLTIASIVCSSRNEAIHAELVASQTR